MKKGTVARSLAFETMREDHEDEPVFLRLTVREFLFEGYCVPFMKTMSDLSGEQLLVNNTFGLYFNVKTKQNTSYFNILIGNLY